MEHGVKARQEVTLNSLEQNASEVSQGVSDVVMSLQVLLDDLRGNAQSGEAKDGEPASAGIIERLSDMQVKTCCDVERAAKLIHEIRKQLFSTDIAVPRAPESLRGTA